jgi:hypothetical protein
VEYKTSVVRLFGKTRVARLNRRLNTLKSQQSESRRMFWKNCAPLKAYPE